MSCPFRHIVHYSPGSGNHQIEGLLRLHRFLGDIHFNLPIRRVPVACTENALLYSADNRDLLDRTHLALPNGMDATEQEVSTGFLRQRHRGLWPRELANKASASDSEPNFRNIVWLR
jgi:hypothetical protein